MNHIVGRAEWNYVMCQFSHLCNWNLWARRNSGMAETAEMVETAEIEEKNRTCSLALLVSVGFHIAMGRIAN